ncbi:MAG TPA: 2,3-bisphosphoglycerate-independent phosphoglycerate mutase [Phycisphaerae bacterium]|nr:2,3-bisphosphoglycerate-independent phosphoglycerate mutase [Phycisphaerae bacterium]HOI55958.1 2,3-bisphosphoglycerate-independent phosphoglycerate mutase [Phycisphaerae bacterium]
MSLDLSTLVQKNDKRIVFLIADGIGSIQSGPNSLTELQQARTPNLDQLAAEGECGLLDPVMPGITPGSGPGHLGLFGYEPTEFIIGRGLLSALGVGFPLKDGDLAARLNFATLDKQGNVVDRRAGRIPTEENERIIAKLVAKLPKAIDGAKIVLQTEAEHRAVLVLRGKGLSQSLADTDPQATGVPPLDPKGLDAKTGTKKTVAIVKKLLSQIRKILADEPKANFVLARGFALHTELPSMAERYGLTAGAIANYPMYRGVASLVGMTLLETGNNLLENIAVAGKRWQEYDFFFIHFKYTDKTGEDGDYEAKVKRIEELDAAIPALRALKPDVVVVTGDHSTPSKLKAHSWHPVPALLWAPATIRRDGVTEFNEVACAAGGMGRLPMKYLMQMALAHADKLMKFGA